MVERSALAASRPWAVGLTGGVAAGKSTVAAAFAALDVPVLDADHAAREVLTPGSAGLRRRHRALRRGRAARRR
ncbi:Dephospho-CoA kinase [mine drainage metagenome]|uniref:Dephospho-CoA kinase n=1 Tax=mine drainage metagenome TaxID=410659 RepID=T1AUS8_9ZZZZ